ncbi:hypothetical protein OIU84_014388 [Salix udensis]|uniref:Uncharacterized protein n=1 Tax=Salix udensis TaxID=889485 RepID=A0AAD6JBV1_9ROSI|nr:hypothetical protein OIU84_014388 [Salix udensis]
MPISKFVSRPCFESQGSPSSTDHQGADDGADKPGGSRRLAVRSAGLSDSIKFEAKKIKKGGKKNIFKKEFQRSITSGFHGGLPIETDQKIEIPIWNIRETSPKDPQQKNMTILTADNSEFQFMDFLRYDKAYQNLQAAIRKAKSSKLSN